MEEKKPNVWIQCPCFNEELNLPVLYERFKLVAEKNPNYNFHFLFIDDHSRDGTSAIIEMLAKTDDRVSGIRLASNVGSHAASSAGLQYCAGDCAIAMSADLQDPPEIIPQMLHKWQNGSKVVWAIRNKHERESILAGILAKMYWLFMKNYVLDQTYPNGADFFLVDRQVYGVINQITERNRSVLALISTVGFEQSSIIYDKQKRLYGKSKWNLSRKIKFTIDSILGYTHLPVRATSMMGICISLVSLLYGISVTINYFKGTPIEGWSSVMLVCLLIGGVQMIMLGVIGEYIWRILDEVRGRPYYVVEKKINISGPDESAKKLN